MSARTSGTPSPAARRRRPARPQPRPAPGPPGRGASSYGTHTGHGSHSGIRNLMVRALPVKALVIMSTMAANPRSPPTRQGDGGIGMRPPSSRGGGIWAPGRRLTSEKAGPRAPAAYRRSPLDPEGRGRGPALDHQAAFPEPEKAPSRRRRGHKGSPQSEMPARQPAASQGCPAAARPGSSPSAGKDAGMRPIRPHGAAGPRSRTSRWSRRAAIRPAHDYPRADLWTRRQQRVPSAGPPGRAGLQRTPPSPPRRHHTAITPQHPQTPTPRHAFWPGPVPRRGAPRPADASGAPSSERLRGRGFFS
jgi:hypothetical protein